MRNKNKYKTYKQRNEAFEAFCERHKCSNCPLGDMNHCTFAWLELDAEIPKTSKDMISELIEEVSCIEIGNEKANRIRIEMATKLLSHREKIHQIWQTQDNEATDEK